MDAKRARAAILAALLGTAPLALSGGAAARVFEPQTFTLDNGLEVIVVENPAQPGIAHMVWYRVGAADEPWGKSGIAHFVEHLMFRGTAEVPDGEFNRIVRREGARSNALTSFDATAYFQLVAPDRLETMMRLEADRMANLHITREAFEPEREVVLEERGQRVDDVPAARMAEQMAAALFQNHPYGIPVIGWRHEIEALTMEDARDFYETWYAPGNAFVVLSGNIDVERARGLAEATYGAVAARDVPARERPREPEAGAADVLVVKSSDQVRVPTWLRMVAVPSHGHDPDGHAHALEVLAEMLSGEDGRLHGALVVEQEIATGAGAGYDATARDLGRFFLRAAPRGDTGLERLAQAIEDEIDRLLEEEIEEAELVRARERVATRAVFARDSLAGPGFRIGTMLAAGASLSDVEAWPERIQAVDVEAVRAAARLLVDARHGRVTGHLLPADPQDVPADVRPEAAAPEPVRPEDPHR